MGKKFICGMGGLRMEEEEGGASGGFAIKAKCASWYLQVYTLVSVFRKKFYCLRQIHLAENLPRPIHTQYRVKTT